MTSSIFTLSRIPFGLGSQKELYQRDQVPEEFKELFILRGYRSPRSSPRQCFYSIFNATNETFNFWTHFLPALYFLWRLVDMWPEMDFFGPDGRFTQPVLALMVNVILFLFMSAIAHTFNAMSDKARHVCFFLDYLAVSLYCIGAAAAYKSYCIPHGLVHSSVMTLYIPVAMINSTFSVMLACQTRFMDHGIRKKLIRFVSFSWPFVWDQMPLFQRLLSCETAQCQGGGASFLWKQNIFATLSAFLYTSHMPERFSPGSFDIIGHSHQLFHIFSVLGTYAQLEGVLLDLQVNREAMMAQGGLNYDQVDNYALVRVAAVTTINAIVVIYFSLRIYRTPSPPPCTNSASVANGYIHKDGVRPISGIPQSESLLLSKPNVNASRRTSKKVE